MLGTGPAAYNVDKKKTQNFAYSMGGKLQDLAFKTANFAPGPGTHEPSRHNGSPNTKFGSGQRSSLDGGKETLGKPGPGQYQGSVDGIKNRSPKFGFGSGKRADMVSRLSVPGPGTYAAKAILGMDGPSKTMASTLAFEPARKEQAYKPGPGSYDGHAKLNVTKKEPAWGMGSGKRVDLAFEKKKLF